jgi:hypothetical protein
MKAHVVGILTMLVTALIWSTPAGCAEPNWPDTLTLGAASPGGTYHA